MKSGQVKTFLFQKVAHGHVHLQAQLEWARKARLEQARQAGQQKATSELKKFDEAQFKRMHYLETELLRHRRGGEEQRRAAQRRAELKRAEASLEQRFCRSDAWRKQQLYICT